MSLELGDGYELGFEANNRVSSKADGGAVDWARVNRIKVVRIGASEETS